MTCILDLITLTQEIPLLYQTFTLDNTIVDLSGYASLI